MITMRTKILFSICFGLCLAMLACLYPIIWTTGLSLFSQIFLTCLVSGTAITPVDIFIDVLTCETKEKKNATDDE